MPRSIWTGAISFWIVNIPVRLYSATENKDISFRQLHSVCNSRLQQKRWCPSCDREVTYDEVERGYEYEKDHYVVLEEEDFDQLPLPSKRTIGLSAFVKAEEIDPVYYEKSYFLEPEETGVKPYALLMRALQEQELTGVATLAIRNKERLVALRPKDGLLMLETLFYPDEIRVERAADWSEIEVSDAELKMAGTLIEMLTQDFDPAQYQDHYRQALLEVINAKLEGQEIVEAEAPAAAASNVVDLMAALKASVEATRKQNQQAAKGSSNGAKAAETDSDAESEEERKPARSRRRKAG